MQDESANTIKDGIELTLKLMQDALKKHNVEQLDPIGTAFNPLMHEAMSMQEDNDVEAGTVLIVFQKGYTLNGRVLRPARVIVSKKSEKAEKSD